MELEIKNLDFETAVKQFDCLIDTLNNIEADLCRVAKALETFNAVRELERIAKALETIAQVMVDENETL